jgi:hypothetical protein
VRKKNLKRSTAKEKKMHPKDDQLRALFDQEQVDQATREHLVRCPDCQARLAEIAARAHGVQVRLDALAPGPHEQPRSPQVAYTRLAANERFTNSSPLTKQRKEFNQTMFTRRPLWTALAMIAVLALIFTLTPASAWASSFLGLFRVQKVQVVTFDPAAAENARTQLEANSEAFHQLFKDDLKVTERGEDVKVTSLEEASAKAGFTPRLPASNEVQTLEVKGGMKAVFTINQPKLQELIDAAGVNVQLSKELDGKTVNVDVPNAVVVTSGCPATKTAKEIAADCTAFVQMPSPTVETPPGLDMTSLGQAMFQFLGLSPDEAQQLSQRIDWTSTLVLPIPQGGKVQYQDVQVDGVTGTFLQEEGQNTYALIWVKDGVLYGLHGPGDLSNALKYAETLK